jgi:hypothetical protein
MALEAELVSVKESLSALTDTARANVEETHRQYRRDLVPVKNTLALFVESRRHVREER